MALLDDLESAYEGVSKLANGDNSSNNQDFSNGFIVPPTPGGDGNGLPASKVDYLRQGRPTRNLIHWFVPEFGVVKMYVNPQNITYNFEKIITPVQTKGGFSVQYWGEQMPTLTITGTTGSSGVEGINVLYEIYRAEQLAFDPMAVSLTAANANAAGMAAARDVVVGGASSLDGLLGDVVDVALGSDPRLPQLSDYPSLASLAFSVEMYYAGWVFRGYFNSFSMTESATDFAWQYNIRFTVTQRRGYRYNYMPFHRSAVNGGSDWSQNSSTFKNGGG